MKFGAQTTSTKASNEALKLASQDEKSCQVWGDELEGLSSVSCRHVRGLLPPGFCLYPAQDQE